jgi:protoheme IX farnesyltransferase
MVRAETYQSGIMELLMSKVQDYVKLIKLRLSLLVVFSSLMGYLYASAGSVDWIVFIGLSFGGFFITAASNAFNQVYEVDIDAVMERTKNRPIPAGRMNVAEGMISGVIMGLLGFYILFKLTNPACAIMGALALLSYVFAYTPMKRVSHISTMIGAIPGALPFAIGWFAFSGVFHFEVVILFLIQFVWQFPHTWAIAWLQRDDYKKVGIKLNPFRESKDKLSAYYIMLYTIALIPASLLPYIYDFTNSASAVLLVLLGLFFVSKTYSLYNEQTNKNAKGVLIGSIIYLPLVQIVLVLDKVIF